MPGRATRYSDEQINWLKVQDAKGVPRTLIVRQFTEQTGLPLSIARLRQIVGTRQTTRSTTAKRVGATVYLPPAELAHLRTLAADLGYRNSYGAAAGEGNLSDLLAAIAAGDVLVIARHASGSSAA